MWNATVIAALAAGLVAVVAAIGAAVAQVMHARNPAAHGQSKEGP